MSLCPVKVFLRYNPIVIDLAEEKSDGQHRWRLCGEILNDPANRMSNHKHYNTAIWVTSRNHSDVRHIMARWRHTRDLPSDPGERQCFLFLLHSGWRRPPHKDGALSSDLGCYGSSLWNQMESGVFVLAHRHRCDRTAS